ncbi:MAG: phytanoyl-CoA dioxygenase family protein [Ilumatobacteraceae bacterium]|nr:phytanoyl-CoA dioxygenase family protein [Acidimicrobiales bacterium]MCB9392831.1 phytanoyl-CoA dioxygenase family protein [Acidimicrobiaceae bacterium]
MSTVAPDTDIVHGADVPRCGPDTPAEEISRLLVTHGVVIVERLADDATCDRLADELGPWIEQTPAGGDAFSGFSTRRTGGLLTKAPSSEALVAHPLVLDVVDRTLWPKKTTFQLHLTQSIAIGPGSPAQMLHRDHWCFDFFPFPRDVDVEVSTIWALTEFTEANGATRVVPDSHRTPDDVKYAFEQTSPAAMPRGSVVLYLGSTVHGGGANTADETRIGINVDYVLGWLRQEENQYLTYSLDEVRAMPERLQRLLGYEVGAYALGYVDGGRSPMELVQGVDPGDTQSFAPS